MPFLSEEIWSGIKKEGDKPLIIKNWPKHDKVEDSLLKEFDHISKLITNIRKYRNEKGISYKEKIELFSKKNELRSEHKSVVFKLANSELIDDISKINDNVESLIVDSKEYFINNLLDKKNDLINIEEDLKYNIGFLKSIQLKLNNKKFIENAPASVVENEKKKEEDTKTKIKMLELKLKK
jgi:valyl-tRNA synthetase